MKENLQRIIEDIEWFQKNLIIATGMRIGKLRKTQYSEVMQKAKGYPADPPYEQKIAYYLYSRCVGSSSVSRTGAPGFGCTVVAFMNFT